MRKQMTSWQFRSGALAVMLSTLICVTAQAATPAAGTLSVTTKTVNYTGGGPYFIASTQEDTCAAPDQCDEFTLTVDLPADYATTNPGDKVHFEMTWSDPSGAADFDFYVHDTKGVDVCSKTMASSSKPEKCDIAAGFGRQTFVVRAKPFAPAGTNYTGKITLVTGVAPPPPPPPPVAGGIAPRYSNYAAPAAVGENSGEPSIGYNLITKKAMFIAGLQTLQVTFPESVAPAGTIPEACPAIWKDVSYIVTKTASLDPILFTDQKTGRTFVSQLNSKGAGPALAGLNSLMAYTDDDGATWTAAQVNPPDGSNDHQTVGAGPYPASVPLGTSVNKGDAVYYCAQSGNVLVATSAAFCSRSDDGGLNFGRATALYADAAGCEGGIHGHVKVAPDGTVYVPVYKCGGKQSVVVSADAGTTWTIRPVPNTTAPPGILDPSVGIATDGTLYFSYVNGDGHPHVAVSKDKGVTWINDRDIGLTNSIATAVFIEAVAGDPLRAAVGFIGTSQPGDHQAATFKGTWYAYIASTFDGGLSWTTVNATPGSPVQKEACIWNQGGNSSCRNLLDFNEITADEKGRVLYGYADGCINDCEAGGPNSFSSKATIARQSGGRGILAKFDPVEPTIPNRCCLSGRRDDTASYLAWVLPDNGGSDITAYKIFRGTTAGTETYIGQQVAGKNTYTDRSVDPSVAKYTYKITAVNALGEGQASNTLELSITPRLELTGACALPGVNVITDPVGDESDGQSSHDITSVSIAEPESLAGKLVFTIKVVSLSTIPPGGRWAVRFSAPQKPPDAAYGPTEDWFVSMVTSDGPTPTFTYGSTGVPQNAARVFTTIGNLDPASNAKADGTITLILPKTAIGSPKPGDGITGMLGSVRATVPSALPGTGGTNETIPDSTGGGSYALRPANLCLPNTAPLALMSATPEQGTKPLTVHFDATASADPDSIDSVAKYTFNFGDGTDDVSQASPVIDYTYTVTGLFAAKLVVTDSRGKLSSNTDQHLIAVNPPSVPPSLTSAVAGTVDCRNSQFILTVTGTNFVSGSVIQVNGQNRPTTFVSATQLTATLPTSDITSGSVTVRVVNPDGATTTTSTATIQSLGDLNLDGRVDATDLVIMANYLVGNMTPGTAPFTAPVSSADLNRDSKNDAVDFVIHANFLAGNITCLPVN